MSDDNFDVQWLLRKYDLKPRKGLGQNFLVSSRALKKVVQAAEIQPDDDVLEIGPGLGSLTRHLARAARRVVAVELDRDLLAPLREAVAGYPNVEIVQGDILECDVSQMMSGRAGYVVAANIPYYITSAVIRHLLAASAKPRSITLTVQEEVAERICAPDGNHSLLSLGVQVFGSPEIRAKITAGAFFPAPNVDSAVVHIDVYETPRMANAELLDDFFIVARAGFSQKRKNLRNSLSGGLGVSKEEAEWVLERAGIEASRRAQTLKLTEWQEVAQAYRVARGTRSR